MREQRPKIAPGLALLEDLAVARTLGADQPPQQSAMGGFLAQDFAIEAKDTLYCCPDRWRAQKGGAIRAPLCGLAYRRLSFGPVACTLGQQL